MTYRECYAQFQHSPEKVAAIHEITCPHMLRHFGVSVESGYNPQCPRDADEGPPIDTIETHCRPCWDKEMEVPR